MLGLMLISEPHRGKGIGRRALQLLERFVQDWGTCDRIRIAVVQSNAGVMPFWISQGFTPTGESRAYRYGSVQSEVVVLEKRFP